MKKKNAECINRVRIHALSVLILLLMMAGCDNISSSEDIDLKEETINTEARAWQPLGTGFHQAVVSLTIHKGDLIAGGYFSTKRGQTVDGIARWDGSEWHSVGTGIDNPGIDGDAGVKALVVYDGDLIAAGTFTTAGGQSANNIARWNGSEWEPLGSGFEYSISTLMVHNGYLIAGGARWDGSEWHAMGGGNVGTFTIHEGDLYAASYLPAVSRWNGLTWQAVGTGTEGYVTSFAIHAGNLIAGGQSPNTLGAGTNHIARWDGSAWQPIGSGMNGEIIALTVHNGDLIAAGSFNTAGGQSANNIARWGTP